MKNYIKENAKKNNDINERINILKVNDPVLLGDDKIKSDLFKSIKGFNKISKKADYQKLINESSNQFYARINEEFHNKFISEEQLDNIDLLRFKIQNNYYFSKKLLLDDIDNMFISIRKKLDIQINTNKIKDKKIVNGTSIISNTESMNIEDEKTKETKDREKEEDKVEHIDKYIIPIQNYKYKDLYIIYLNIVYIRLIQLIQSISLDELIEADINLMISNNKLPKSSMSISSMPIRKEFEIISDYHHIKPEETNDIMITKINPECDGTCCKEINQLGPFNLDNSRWNCSCKDRSKNIECDPNKCKCSIEKCKNLSLYKREYKQINIDVEERYSWGIDLYTYRNLLYIFPENFDIDNQYYKDFIEKTLILVINKISCNDNKIYNACDYIIKNSTMYSNIDYNLAKHLSGLFESTKLTSQLFNVYCKGVGIFCKKKEGIKQNELIAPYLGEIYSPYLWYEKQDLIKAKKMDKNLPDFYNIMLERMKSDPDGYNLIMIDPNSKGNFASRMSHSCVPNCNTVLMVSKNKYTIGMYAMKDIVYDEELTFDYNSITENQKEYQMAICLCSSYFCRGHYLILSNSMIFTEIINKFHTFLHRNAILLRASYLAEQPLKDNEIKLLKKYSIGNSLLNKCPIWLQRWAALTIYFIDLERQLLPIILYKAEERERDLNKKSLLKKKGKKKEDIKIKKKRGKPKKRIKEKSNSKKRSASNKSFTINKYNFDSDFVWIKKSYRSKTRQNVAIDKSKEESNFDNIFKRIRNKSKSKKENEKITTYEKDKNKNKKEQKNMEDLNNNENKIFNNDYDEDINKIIKDIFDNNDTDIEFINLCNKNNKNYNFEKDEIEMINIEEDSSFDFLADQNLKLDKDYDQNLYEAYKNQVSGIVDQRIQSLAITLDKIKHVLNLIGPSNYNEPPLRFLTEKEIYELHWKPMKEYLRENFIKLKDKTKDNKYLQEKYQRIIIALTPPIFMAGEFNYKSLNTESKEIIIKISKILYEISQKEKETKLLDYKSLADILYLYAQTKVLFTANKNINGSFYGENIQILKRDVDNSCVPNEFINSPLDTVIAEGKKEYENNYIWGQLVGWYKQTVDKPNASLSAERKGVLCYPDIESFFWNENVSENNEINYPCGGRIPFYEKIKDNISMSWPTTNQWSFKNRNKIYGTIQFDSIIFGNFHLDKVEQYYSYLINKLFINESEKGKNIQE